MRTIKGLMLVLWLTAAALAGCAEDPRNGTSSTGLDPANADAKEAAPDAPKASPTPAPVVALPGTIPEALLPRAPLGEVLFMSPHAGDAPTLYSLDRKYLGAHADPGPVVGGVLWGDRVLYMDKAFSLFELGVAEPIAKRVYGTPVVSPDGKALAYVAVDGQHADTRAVVRLRDGAGDRVLDRSLFNLGDLRFAPDGSGVIGFGVVNGGVAGLHTISLEGKHACLTNCELRTGTDWGNAHVELPADIADVPYVDGRWLVGDAQHETHLGTTDSNAGVTR